MDKFKNSVKELRSFIILWSTQSLSALGSSMTSYGLVIWSYQQHGSALMTALLSVCSYGPYVLMSIFAGAVSDRRNKKKTMLVCDTLAAACTAAGKGSGAGFLFSILGAAGVLTCVIFRRDAAIWRLEK